MLRVGPYVFKKADADHEFDQIHRLNFRTFVTEIGQHADPGTDRLVDKFHHKNEYFIVLKGERVVGMLCTHDRPPFSIADRLPDPSVLQQPGMHILEVRLMALEPNERISNLFFGLIHVVYQYAVSSGKTHFVISGVSDRLRIYKRLGFVEMGPPVPSGNASFVPMILDISGISKRMHRVIALWESHIENRLRADKSEWLPNADVARRSSPAEAARALAEAEICLLPGPVPVQAEVRRAFLHPPIYHRGPAFIERFAQVRDTLGNLVGRRRVALLNGSGTLANETVGATLAAIDWNGRGVLLVNGEFGERLELQAGRFGLEPRILKWEWGKPWDLDEIDDVLSEEAPSWIWGVHQESSTGLLNDLPGLVRVAKRHGFEVCADCISSLGAVPVDLRDVLLATGSSGKSLGAIAGAAIIFSDPKIPGLIDRSRVPSYFDLPSALASQGPCYTFPSSTLLALESALEAYRSPEKAQEVFDRYDELGRYVRWQLRNLHIEPLAAEEHASPVLTTFSPPGHETSEAFVNRCLTWGYAIGGQSGYLARRRLVQIATMGAVTRDMCESFFAELGKHLTIEPVLSNV